MWFLPLSSPSSKLGLLALPSHVTEKLFAESHYVHAKEMIFTWDFAFYNGPPQPRCELIEISGQLWKGNLSSLVYRWETQWGNLPQGHMVSNWYGPNAVQDSWLPISFLGEFWAIQFEISSITVDSNKHMDRSVLSTGIFQLNVFEDKDWIFKDKAGREITMWVVSGFGDVSNFQRTDWIFI